MRHVQWSMLCSFPCHCCCSCRCVVCRSSSRYRYIACRSHYVRMVLVAFLDEVIDPNPPPDVQQNMADLGLTADIYAMLMTAPMDLTLVAHLMRAGRTVQPFILQKLAWAAPGPRVEVLRDAMLSNGFISPLGMSHLHKIAGTSDVEVGRRRPRPTARVMCRTLLLRGVDVIASPCALPLSTALPLRGRTTWVQSIDPSTGLAVCVVAVLSGGLGQDIVHDYGRHARQERVSARRAGTHCDNLGTSSLALTQSPAPCAVPCRHGYVGSIVVD